MELPVKRELRSWAGVLLFFIALCAVVILVGAARCPAQTSPVPFPVPPSPPISAGPVVKLNGHLAVNGQRITCFGVNFDFSSITGLCNPNKQGQLALDPNQQAVYLTELNTLQAAGVDFVRILGIDASNINPIFAAGTTTAFDPGKVAALDWFLSQLEQRNIRYALALHYTRALVASDLPAGASALAQECVAQNKGNMLEAVAFDCATPPPGMAQLPGATGTLQALQMGFNQKLLRHPNQFTGVAIGDSNALAFVEVENECPFVKNDFWSEPATQPVLLAAFNADVAAWCAANNIPPNQCGAVQHYQWRAWRETVWLGNVIANLRTLTHALIVPNTYFGDGPYAMLSSSIALGDGISFHVYSRNAASDSNGFLNGRVGVTPADARSRISAVAAGCSFPGLFTACTEFGPQWQSVAGNPSDPPMELILDLPAVTWQLVWADTDAMTPYSWAQWAIWKSSAGAAAPGVSEKNGPYDLRNVPQLVRVMRGCSDIFHDLTLRPKAITTVPPTGGMFGTMTTTTTGAAVFQIYGPSTDPKPFGLPPTTKVQIAP